MKLMRSLLLVALYFGACAVPSAPRPNATVTRETIPSTPSGVQIIQDTPTPDSDGAPARPCLLAEANLQRLHCRPEGFAKPGADRFAVLCEHVSALRHIDAVCLAQASTLAAIRECRSGVQCADSSVIERNVP